jgi:6,7-dimethyl-8-ribityllumazine synthase
MASVLNNLSNYNPKNVPEGDKFRFALVVSEWNPKITEALFEAAFKTLVKHKVLKENIIRIDVPGSFELVYGASKAQQMNVDGVISIGSVIQGETRHFEFICNAIAHGMKDLNLSGKTPVIFCLLTDDTMAQSEARSGGSYGNKGVEAAVAALKMAAIY